VQGLVIFAARRAGQTGKIIAGNPLDNPAAIGYNREKKGVAANQLIEWADRVGETERIPFVAFS